MATMAVALDRNLFLASIFQLRFPNLTRAYGNNGRRPRQKLVFGILQLNSKFKHHCSIYRVGGIRITVLVCSVLCLYKTKFSVLKVFKDLPQYHLSCLSLVVCHAMLVSCLMSGKFYPIFLIKCHVFLSCPMPRVTRVSSRRSC